MKRNSSLGGGAKSEAHQMLARHLSPVKHPGQPNDMRSGAKSLFTPTPKRSALKKPKGL